MSGACRHTCAYAAERVAEILDRVLSLDYATVTPEVQTAHQPEHEIAPHHHADPAPAHNGFFEQASLGRPCGNHP